MKKRSYTLNTFARKSSITGYILWVVCSMWWWLDWVLYSSGSRQTSNLKLAKWVLVGIDLKLRAGLPPIGLPFSNPWFSKPPHNPRGGGAHDPCYWFETLTLLKTRNAQKIPTLFKTTFFMLGPCIGQLTQNTTCSGQAEEIIYPV